MRVERIASTVLLFPVTALALAGAPVVLEDFEDLNGWKVTRRPAVFEATSDAGVEEGAIHLTMPGMVSRTLAKSYVSGNAPWDQYQGVSFWVKGDGSDQFGCLAVAGRYAYATYFPLQRTEWHKVTVRWSGFVPEQQVDGIGAFGSMPPSGITTLRFGSRWTIYHNNARIPQHEYWVDHIQLEDVVTEPGPVPAPRPLAHALGLLSQGKPVRIQCMGDSITAGTSLADKDESRYATLVERGLRRWLGVENITCISRAVGGARSTDARAWVPRDFVGPVPDLVTVWYGYNDKSGAYTCDYYERSISDYVDRVCRVTDGRAAILLVAPGPGCGPRFVMMDDYADAVRRLARARQLGLFDVHKVLKSIGREEIQRSFADMAHPNEKGHRAIADALCELLVTSAGIRKPKPPPPPKPVVAPGRAQHWDFEEGGTDWVFDCDEVTCVQGKGVSGVRCIGFDLPAPAKDHRRAYSPALPVQPGQEYIVRAKLLTQSVGPGGRFGVYVCAYDNDRGTGEAKVIPVRGGPGLAGQWFEVEGEVVLPRGSVVMKVMVWAFRETIATFYCDDVSLSPVLR